MTDRPHRELPHEIARTSVAGPDTGEPEQDLAADNLGTGHAHGLVASAHAHAQLQTARSRFAQDDADAYWERKRQQRETIAIASAQAPYEIHLRKWEWFRQNEPIRYADGEFRGKKRNIPLSGDLTTLEGLNVAMMCLSWMASNYPGLATIRKPEELEKSSFALFHAAMARELKRQVYACQENPPSGCTNILAHSGYAAVYEATCLKLAGIEQPHQTAGGESQIHTTSDLMGDSNFLQLVERQRQQEYLAQRAADSYQAPAVPARSLLQLMQMQQAQYREAVFVGQQYAAQAVASSHRLAAAAATSKPPSPFTNAAAAEALPSAMTLPATASSLIRPLPSRLHSSRWPAFSTAAANEPPAASPTPAHHSSLQPLPSDAVAVTAAALAPTYGTDLFPILTQLFVKIDGYGQQHQQLMQQHHQLLQQNQQQNQQHSRDMAELKAALRRVERQTEPDKAALPRPSTKRNVLGGYGYARDAVLGHCIPITPAQQLGSSSHGHSQQQSDSPVRHQSRRQGEQQDQQQRQTQQNKVVPLPSMVGSYLNLYHIMGRGTEGKPPLMDLESKHGSSWRGGESQQWQELLEGYKEIFDRTAEDNEVNGTALSPTKVCQRMDSEREASADSNKRRFPSHLKNVVMKKRKLREDAVIARHIHQPRSTCSDTDDSCLT